MTGSRRGARSQKWFLIVAMNAVGLTLATSYGTAYAQARAGDIARPPYSAADVRFMQGMIAHHAQALDMTALLPSRTTRENMRLLAQRIEVSQKDEIALMQRWLAVRHERVPTLDELHAHYDTSGHQMAMPGMSMSDMHMGNMLMPGMLTPEQLAELAKTKGADFDRLFLQDMIRHHEGALVMVRDLLATNGAAQEPEIFQFASDIDADQRAEIMRMRALLDASPGATRRQ